MIDILTAAFGIVAGVSLATAIAAIRIAHRRGNVIAVLVEERDAARRSAERWQASVRVQGRRLAESAAREDALEDALATSQARLAPFIAPRKRDARGHRLKSEKVA